MKLLFTGTAGFIGSHVAQRLLERGDDVIGFENLSDHCDVNLKKARWARFMGHPPYTHVTADLADRVAVGACLATHKPQRVANLAAQAGVCHAAENLHVYASSNITETLHVLEGCRHHCVKKLVFASTSSVCGANTKMPSSEYQPAEHSLTLCAATKKAKSEGVRKFTEWYRSYRK